MYYDVGMEQKKKRVIGPPRFDVITSRLFHRVRFVIFLIPRRPFCFVFVYDNGLAPKPITLPHRVRRVFRHCDFSFPPPTRDRLYSQQWLNGSVPKNGRVHNVCVRKKRKNYRNNNITVRFYT